MNLLTSSDLITFWQNLKKNSEDWQEVLQEDLPALIIINTAWMSVWISHIILFVFLFISSLSLKSTSDFFRFTTESWHTFHKMIWCYPNWNLHIQKILS